MILYAFGRQPSIWVLLMCPRLTEAVDEPLNLPGRDFIHVEMTKGIIDAWGHRLVVLLGTLAQIGAYVLLEPLLREGLELDMTIPKSRSAAFFVEKDHLTGQLFFNLFAGHARRRRPAHGFYHLLAVCGISAEGLDAV